MKPFGMAFTIININISLFMFINPGETVNAAGSGMKLGTLLSFRPCYLYCY